MKVSMIKPMTDDLLEAYLGAEYDDVVPDHFTFEGDDGCSGIVVADDTGIEVTINSAIGDDLIVAIEWNIKNHNRTVLQVVYSAAMNSFGGRFFATHLAIIGFVKAH